MNNPTERSVPSCLLVIDDEQETNDYLRTYFQRLGLEVLTATTGEEGLEILAAQRPSLVLLDLRLGQGLSGIEVLRRAKASKIPAEIVVVTAVGDQNVAAMAKGLGAADYLTKPFLLEDLERVVLSRLKG